MAHAFPGTELYNYAAENGFLRTEALTDSLGHQLPHIEYPNLSREDMMAGVRRFYDSYYFRPRIIWRIVRKALWDSNERKRLVAEGMDFLRTRREWKQKVKKGIGEPKPAMVTVPVDSTSGTAASD